VQVVVMKIDVRGDASLYDHVLSLFSDLERAWAEIARTPAPPAPAAPGPAARPVQDGGTRGGFSLRA
jgi:hypothetical protein